jgi:signal transduction histidine kinase
MHGFAQLLSQDYSDKLDSQAIDYLRRITVSAARLDLMIRDILNYAGLVRQGLPLEDVDLDRLVAEILESYPNLQSPLAEISVLGKLPSVRANVSALTQCVSNLLDNAVKFVAQGVQPRVTIRAEARGQAIRLWFEDNGIGIPDEWQGRIFGIFQQVHGTGAYGGTGIGLTVVRKAVERMGGRVGVVSAPNQGSRFWIELQRATGVPASPANHHGV